MKQCFVLNLKAKAEFFDYINVVLSKEVGVVHVYCKQGTLFCCAYELAKAESVNNIDTNLSLDSSALSPELEPFTFYSVTCTEVQRIILSMPSNKSPGLDKISMRVIKDSLPVILGPLTDIVNSSFATSTFPEAWKIAEVI